MDIGTAKPSKDTLGRIPHHMIDVVDPFEEYDVRTFQSDARPVVAKALEDGRRIVISGGSGLHFRALVDPMTFAPTDADVRSVFEAMPRDVLQRQLRNLDVRVDAIVDMSNRRRLVRALEVHQLTGETPSDRHNSAEAEAVRRYEPTIPHVSLGFDAGDQAHDRASDRFRGMVDDGLITEVTRLCSHMGRNASQAVGYKEMLPVISGGRTLAEGIAAAITATNKLIKRQRTYFRRDPRVQWMPWSEDAGERIEQALAFIEKEATWIS